MKRLIAVFALICAIFVGGQTAWAYEFETYDMEGSVGKYDVKVYLKVNTDTGRASGWYYYKSQGSKKKIQLTGTVGKLNYSNCANMTMTEKVDGKVTGTFRGEFCESARGFLFYHGTWTSPKGKKLEFDFYDMWD